VNVNRRLVEDGVGRVVGFAVIAHEVDVRQEHFFGLVEPVVELLLDL
jgi:hypothetical protein